MNQKFTNPKNELTFTKNYSLITASTKLTALEKLLIARVLNWQQSDKICSQSNNALAQELGESLSTLKRTITKLNKTSFFVSKETSHFNEFGTWSNSKEIVIDEVKLFEYVSTDSQPINEEPIQPEAAPEPFKKVHQPEVAPEEIEATEPIQNDEDEETSLSYIKNKLIENKYFNELDFFLAVQPRYNRKFKLDDKVIDKAYTSYKRKMITFDEMFNNLETLVEENLQFAS